MKKAKDYSYFMLNLFNIASTTLFYIIIIVFLNKFLIGEVDLQNIMIILILVLIYVIAINISYRYKNRNKRKSWAFVTISSLITFFAITLITSIITLFPAFFCRGDFVCLLLSFLAIIISIALYPILVFFITDFIYKNF